MHCALLRATEGALHGPASSKSLPDEMHKFLFPTIHNFQVIYKLCETHVSIRREVKRLSCLPEELDEVAICDFKLLYRCVNNDTNQKHYYTISSSSINYLIL